MNMQELRNIVHTKNPVSLSKEPCKELLGLSPHHYWECAQRVMGHTAVGNDNVEPLKDLLYGRLRWPKRNEGISMTPQQLSRLTRQLWGFSLVGREDELEKYLIESRFNYIKGEEDTVFFIGFSQLVDTDNARKALYGTIP